uniref:Uncharacterized protein n=1 Tax=Arundo donax TaxID=35708 RepID=A0A0A9DRB6_ARUDO
MTMITPLLFWNAFCPWMMIEYRPLNICRLRCFCLRRKKLCCS